MRTNTRIFPRIFPRLFERDASLAGFGLVDSGALLSFHAAWADAAGVSQTLLVGTSTVTTDHAEAIYAPDHEGVYREFAVDAPVWAYGRVVENRVTDTEIPTGPWGTPAGGGTKENVTDIYPHPLGWQVWLLSGAGSWHTQTGMLATTNDIRRIDARTVSGSGNVNLMVHNSVASGLMDITEEWQTFSISGTAGVAPTIFYGADFRAGNLTQVLVAAPQFEDATGRSDTTTPSEYIPTTTAAVQKVFSYANGNTVASGVVTEALGSDFADAPYLVSQPEGTNLTIYSNELITGWTEYGTGSVTQDAEGINGQQNEAVTLVDSDVSAFHYAVSTTFSVVGATTITLRVYVKKQASFATTLQISNKVGGGVYRLQINPVTGEAYERDAANGIYEVVDDGLWWIVLCHSAGDGSNSNTSIYTAINSSGANGTTDVTAQGFCVIGNVEAYIDKTIAEVKSLGPIFTTSAAASTSAFDNEYPAANHSNTEGPLYLEFENTGDDVVLLSAGTDEFLKITSNQLILDDGTTQISTACAAGEHKAGVAFDADNNLMNLNLDDSWETQAAYDDTLGSGVLTFGETMRKVKRWNETDIDKQEDIIDREMA